MNFRLGLLQQAHLRLGLFHRSEFLPQQAALRLVSLHQEFLRLALLAQPGWLVQMQNQM